MTTLNKLEALAKAAAVNNDWSFWKNLTVAIPTEQYPDGDYIAAANPDTILQMIELIRRLGDALEYAADLTIPEELYGCECPICKGIDALKEFK